MSYFLFTLFPRISETEDQAPITPILPNAPIQKHYKIIFIKAPSTPNYNQQIIQQLAPQTEEKTLVYVLSKKPEYTAPEILSTKAAAPPSKPEVYFIKYKAQKELSAPVSLKII